MYEPKQLKSGGFSISAWVTEVPRSRSDIAAVAAQEAAEARNEAAEKAKAAQLKA